MCVAGSQAVDLLRANAASGNPPSIPRVQCWCASYPNQSFCSWPEPPHSPPIHYIATYSERHRQLDTKHCQLIRPGSSSSALISASSSSDRLWHCLLPDLKLFTDYIINITAVYPGKSSSSLKSFMLEEIVKPNPPVDVRVSPHLIKGLTLEWSAPPTWANLDIFPLIYEIQYHRESTGTPQYHNVDTHHTKIELVLVTPGTYQFQVCAKELLGLGKCSDWSSPVNITIPKTKL
ncbi:interleukin-27 subunit beta [Scomber japonicus]|uniref:interleukin-27 subunit beta n=1 Tax=Scomber japonicus TaxID=13676 RepID=UPI0023056305|nr:interleukin-27 subunit beta [Scomber japonicus]